MTNFLVNFVSVVCDLLSFAVVARILLSWFPSSNTGRLRSTLYELTEPYLAFFRNLIPRMGMLDISPIIALLALDIIKSVIIYIIVYLAGL